MNCPLKCADPWSPSMSAPLQVIFPPMTFRFLTIVNRIRDQGGPPKVAALCRKGNAVKLEEPLYVVLTHAPSALYETEYLPYKKAAMPSRHLRLRLRLYCGRDLKAANFARQTSDPYVIIRVRHDHGNPFRLHRHSKDDGDSSDKEWRSKVLLNTVSPLWNQVLVLEGVHENDTLELRCMDWNRVAKDVELGVGILSIREALERGRKELLYKDRKEKNEDEEEMGPGAAVCDGTTYDGEGNEVGVSEGLDTYTATSENWREMWGRKREEETETRELQKPTEKAERLMAQWYQLNTKGQLLISVREMGPDEDEDGDCGVFYRKFVNHRFLGKLSEEIEAHFERIPGSETLGKVLSPITTPVTELLMPLGTKGQFPTYKFSMKFVKEVFGDKRQHWNTKYNNARMIFGKIHYPVRVMIRTQHTLLYGGGIRGIPIVKSSRVELSQETGFISSGDEFVKLFNGGVRHGKSRMYTYVLMEDTLYCCETGAQFFADQRSKHAMHCNCAEEVVYAGEFHFRFLHAKDNNGENTERALVLDNNSGTYAPDKKDLWKLGNVFELNFPGLQVELLDHESKTLEQYAAEMREQGIV